MDIREFEELKQKNVTSEATPPPSGVMTIFEEYITTGAPGIAYIDDDTVFDQTLQFLNLNNVRASQIVHYHVTDTATGGTRDSETDHTRLFSGEGTVKTWPTLSTLIDRVNPFMEDSNYRATIVIRLDETTSVAIGEMMWDVSDGEDLEYKSQHWVALFHSGDLEKFPRWSEWDLTEQDPSIARAAKLAAEARIIEREKAEGAVNLSRLEAGDQLCIVTKWLDPGTEAGRYKHLSPEQKDERFTDTWNVVVAGEQPLCAIGNTQVRLLGGGRWTTRRQNPVQRQDRAITPSWGYLYPGQHVLHQIEGQDERSYSETVIESMTVIKPGKYA